MQQAIGNPTLVMACMISVTVTFSPPYNTIVPHLTSVVKCGTIVLGDNMSYYDGTKLLSLKDLNGNKPEIILCTTNRTAGKTTYFSRLCVNRFLKHGEKFALLYRFIYELSDVAEKFFSDIGSLFFPGYVMTVKSRVKGAYFELYLNDELCGYAIALNSAETIKRCSHVFNEVERIFFDEFQSETNHYCNDEIKKLISIHTSIARGQGKQVRYVPLYACGNTVSLLNPYYVALGISGRLKDDTKFLRGNGYVLEQGYVESASLAQLESGFNQAFNNDSYVAYSSQGLYLHDNSAFIDKPSGQSNYLVTIKSEGSEYGIREYAQHGVIYCDDTPDQSYPCKLAVTTADHNINYVMLKRYKPFIEQLRYYFDKGCFRFKNLQCKDAILKLLSY